MFGKKKQERVKTFKEGKGSVVNEEAADFQEEENLQEQMDSGIKELSQKIDRARSNQRMPPPPIPEGPSYEELLDFYNQNKDHILVEPSPQIPEPQPEQGVPVIAVMKLGYAYFLDGQGNIVCSPINRH